MLALGSCLRLLIMTKNLLSAGGSMFSLSANVELLYFDGNCGRTLSASALCHARQIVTPSAHCGLLLSFVAPIVEQDLLRFPRKKELLINEHTLICTKTDCCASDRIFPTAPSSEGSEQEHPTEPELGRSQ